MINRRKFIHYGSAGLMGTVLLNSCRQDTRQQINGPNIIVLIADDLRWDCLGMYNKIIQTPNLDLLGDRGTVFLNNFVTTSICPTSRASILTGLYARSHQIWDFERPLTRRQWRSTYPYLFKQANYITAFIGKWGLGGKLPSNKFDYWGGFAEQGNYYTEDRQEHLTSYLTGQAEDFIASQRGSFCLTMSYKAPHVDEDPEDPFIPDTKYAQQYEDVTIPRYQPLTSESLPKFLQQTEAQIRYDYRFKTEELYQKSVKNYYRLVSGIDESLGRIVRAVEQQNFTQDTYIIFTSDNGFFLGEKGLAGKWFGFEAAIRTPLIINCVNKPLSNSQTVKDMSLNIDIAPTVLALAGINTQPVIFHGRNLTSKQHIPRKWWFYEHLFQHSEINIPSNVGIRSQQYKYLFFPEHDYEMLFDLDRDPQETVNLATNSQYQTVLAEYQQLLQQAESTLTTKS